MVQHNAALLPGASSVGPCSHGKVDGLQPVGASSCAWSLRGFRSHGTGNRETLPASKLFASGHSMEAASACQREAFQSVENRLRLRLRSWMHVDMKQHVGGKPFVPSKTKGIATRLEGHRY